MTVRIISLLKKLKKYAMSSERSLAPSKIMFKTDKLEVSYLILKPIVGYEFMPQSIMTVVLLF